MSTVATPCRFDELEAAIASLPPVDPEVVHHFSPGLYAREMRLVPGTVLTGKKHRGPCLNVVQGDITVFDENTGEGRRIAGYACFRSEGGTRRAGFAHAMTSWITFHPTNETDLEKIEAEVIEPAFNSLLEDRRAIL
jgi:hypothetical protein